MINVRDSMSEITDSILYTIRENKIPIQYINFVYNWFDAQHFEIRNQTDKKFVDALVNIIEPENDEVL